jgi:DNA-binding transcriptional ArsR family regulator
LSVDIPRLGKTLSDETRLEILQVLRQDGPMSYVDLLNTLKITNTGRLNYHLKVLADLVKKDGSDGRYGLSEKGVVALELLDRFQRRTDGMTPGFSVPPVPYEGTARALQAVLVLEVVATIIVDLYAYLASPALVPLHYVMDGVARTSVSREIFLLLAVLLNIPQLVFLVLSIARHRLVNRYPASMSIPRLQASLAQMDYERRGYWINRMFSAILVVGVVVGAMMTLLTVSIYESSLSAGSLSSSVVVLVILVVAMAVLCLVYQELRYSREMVVDARGSKKR